MNIIKSHLNKGQYLEDVTVKKQIYLHHTAGNSSGLAVVSTWNANADKIATSYAVTGKVNSQKEKDGDIIECFDDKHWAYHLGLKQDLFTANKVPYQSLDKISIGIEVCNWGQLTKQADGTFLNYVKRAVPKEEVTELATPFKGYKFWHSYTDAQIQGLKELLLFLGEKHKINLKYNPDIWDITVRALKGENGVFSHNSVRKDKVDMYPHPKLIEMLKTL
jgi:hypothetical protein